MKMTRVFRLVVKDLCILDRSIKPEKDLHSD